jgi:hypothetical protein
LSAEQNRENTIRRENIFEKEIKKEARKSNYVGRSYLTQEATIRKTKQRCDCPKDYRNAVGISKEKLF